MTKEELHGKILLDELLKLDISLLGYEARHLLNAILKMADERDSLKEENNQLKEQVKSLQKGFEKTNVQLVLTNNELEKSYDYLLKDYKVIK